MARVAGRGFAAFNAFASFSCARFVLPVAALVLASCSSSSPTTSLPASADTGFKLSQDGFQFDNYGADYDGSYMDTDLAVRMFGAANVCVDGASPCMVTDSAQAWIDDTNAQLDNGHCEGLAVLSQLFYLKVLEPTTFGAATTNALAIDDNYPLQREIAYWFSTQLVPGAATTKALQPKDAIPFMASFMAPGSKDFYRIGIVQLTSSGFGEGHSLTPIGFLRGATANVYYIRVYDTNFPDIEKQIELDVDKNTWTYDGVGSTGNVAYSGGASTGNPLYFASVTSREGVLACPFCMNDTMRTVTVRGGTPMVTVGAGAPTGIDNGQVVMAPGASVTPGFIGCSSCVPDKAVVQITAPAKGSDPVAIALSPGSGGPSGSSVTVAGGALGNVVLSGDFTSGSQAAQLQVTSTGVMIQSTGQSTSFSVVSPDGKTQTVITVSGGAGNVTLSVDPTTGAISVNAANAPGATVGVTLLGATTAAGRPSATYTVVGGAGGTTLTVATPMGGWTGGTPPAATTAQTGADGGAGATTPVVASSCSDGVKDGSETDVDCGGSCPTKCPTSSGCATDKDCSGTHDHCTLLQGGKAKTCNASCTDQVKDEDEIDVDCGGAQCDFGNCKLGQACVTNTSCEDSTTYCSPVASKCAGWVSVRGNVSVGDGSSFFASGAYNNLGIQLAGTSAEPIASTTPGGTGDFAFDKAEVSGAYAVTISAQPPGFTCQVKTGGTGNVGTQTAVNGIAIVCNAVVDTCKDGRQDSDESGVDCGGAQCATDGKYCSTGAACATSQDCGAPARSASCANGTCQPTINVVGTLVTGVPIAINLTPANQSTETQPSKATYSGYYQFLASQLVSGAAFNLSVTSSSATTASPLYCRYNRTATTLGTLTPINGTGTPDKYGNQEFDLQCGTCSDGVADVGETDVDCGGPDCVGLGDTCIYNAKCTADTDCGTGLTCAPQHVCTGPGTCSNGTKDGTETDVDCGGASCDAAGKTCNVGAACLANADCGKSGACANNVCVNSSCSDGVKDGTETDVDCGGAVCDGVGKTCAVGKACSASQDCGGSNACTAGKCVAGATCTDNVKDGTETDVDCGGGVCDAASKTCAIGKTCGANADCASNSCDPTSRKCVSCSDKTKDGTETGTDCGGATCDALGDTCAIGIACGTNADCGSGYCNPMTTTCAAAASCTDAIKDGTETDVDCGGMCVAQGKACALGKGCLLAADCTSGNCTNDVCGAAGHGWTVVNASFGPATATTENGIAVSSTDILATSADTLGTFNGTTWTSQQPFGAGTNILGMYAKIDSSTTLTDIWVTGAGNIVQYWNGTGWFAQTTDAGGTTNLNAISGAANTVLIVGTGGTVEQYASSTQTFASAFGGGMMGIPGMPPTGADLYGVFVLDDNHQWAVGNSGAIIHGNPAMWSLDTSPVATALRSVWGSSASDVWAVGDNGVIVHWNGTAWSKATSGTTANLYSVWGDSATTVWAVGAGGTIVGWNGTVWTAESAGTTNDLHSVFGVGGVRRATGANNSFIERN
jgi:hypothetical protein